MSFQAAILAAGKGTRMRSNKIKVLHEILGRPLIDWVVDAAFDSGAEHVAVVLGHDRERVEAHLSSRADAEHIAYAVQEEQHGTGHAVWEARDGLSSEYTHTLVLYGDVPNLSADTIKAFIADAAAANKPLAVMTAVLDDPARYGRIIRDESGDPIAVVEYKDATDEQRAIQEINTGIYLARTDFMLRELELLCSKPPNNAQNEYYLTDLVEFAANQEGVFGWALDDIDEIQGVNTRKDLSVATEFARRRINQKHMLSGVTLLDPATTYIGAGVTIEQDTVIYPQVTLEGNSSIATGTHIESGTLLRDAQIGRDCHIKASCYITEAKVEDGASVGPFAHLRPGADIGQGCKVGNFVEIKKTRMNAGSKASHLTYLGDAEVGEKANIGAGTITCNYDGENKFKTTIGAGAFIGSNSSLVAPVTIADGAYVGAGSTITADIPEGALGVARGKQRNIEGWVERTKKK